MELRPIVCQRSAAGASSAAQARVLQDRQGVRTVGQGGGQRARPLRFLGRRIELPVVRPGCRGSDGLSFVGRVTAACGIRGQPGKRGDVAGKHDGHEFLGSTPGGKPVPGHERARVAERAGGMVSGSRDRPTDLPAAAGRNARADGRGGSAAAQSGAARGRRGPAALGRAYSAARIDVRPLELDHAAGGPVVPAIRNQFGRGGGGGGGPQSAHRELRRAAHGRVRARFRVRLPEEPRRGMRTRGSGRGRREDRPRPARLVGRHARGTRGRRGAACRTTRSATA